MSHSFARWSKAIAAQLRGLVVGSAQPVRLIPLRVPASRGPRRLQPPQGG